MTAVLPATFMLYLLALSGCQSSVSACATGWFGPKCQYKCHCTNNNCESSGECRAGSTCVVEWFGPACQYQDLFSLRTTTTAPAADVLKDRNDNTCVTSGLNTLTVTFNMSYPITWIRFKLRQPGSLNNVTMTFSQDQKVVHHCNLTSRKNDRTVDSFCGDGRSADQVRAEGQGLNSLCSLYISGGRNVALKQRAFQSSIYKENGMSVDASNAVDGNRTSYLPYNSCTHTGLSDPSPQWNLTLSRPQLVYRYDIYNRDPLGERIFEFIVTGLSPDGLPVMNYTIPRILKPLYSIISNPSVISGLRVYITQREKILSLCEVEIYGDSACEAFNYGFECNKPCHCENKAETCHVATGACPSGCAAGFYGEECLTPCPTLTWGVDCVRECSVHCVNQTCHRMTGACDFGCHVGYSGDNCTYECANSTWGKDCSGFCSSQCWNRTCNVFTGVCTNGCNSGYLGDNCTEDCPPLTWGVGCLNSCSAHCVNKTCAPIDGRCEHGCEDGYTGDRCDEDVNTTACPAMTWGDNCEKPCSDHCVDKLCTKLNGDCDNVEGSTEDRLGMGIGIGMVISFIVCAIIGVIMFYVWRRKQRELKRKQFVGSSRTIVDNDYNQTDDKKYNTLTSYEAAAYTRPIQEAMEVGEAKSMDKPLSDHNVYEASNDCVYIN
ncbi:unnamed protein product [Lymnaea stagnalis]|uniref:Multiple epidermal growth factor-like domains protein 10 n=1 Tax=Lymnaea stagnalis TaxID=6523 RepID=A0AAV2HJ24_LYMST